MSTFTCPKTLLYLRDPQTGYNQLPYNHMIYLSPCLAGQLIPVLSEAATKHFNSSGIYENQTVIEQRGCFFIWKEWKVRLILAFFIHRL